MIPSIAIVNKKIYKTSQFKEDWRADDFQRNLFYGFLFVALNKSGIFIRGNTYLGIGLHLLEKEKTWKALTKQTKIFEYEIRYNNFEVAYIHVNCSISFTEVKLR